MTTTTIRNDIKRQRKPKKTERKKKKQILRQTDANRQTKWYSGSSAAGRGRRIFLQTSVYLFLSDTQNFSEFSNFITAGGSSAADSEKVVKLEWHDVELSALIGRKASENELIEASNRFYTMLPPVATYIWTQCTASYQYTRPDCN